MSGSELFDLDFDFYAAMTGGTGNRVMGLLINTVRDAVRSYAPVLTQLTSPTDTVRLHHRALIEAVEARDADRAGRIADEYLGIGAERVVAMMASGELPPPGNPGNGAGHSDRAAALMDADE